jgi:SAM-dependent methyltransferase
VEWAWIAANIPPGPGTALDFGSSGTPVPLYAVFRDYAVTAIDLMPAHFNYMHSAIEFIQGDLITKALPQEAFDVVLNCSTIEHVGLSGRYEGDYRYDDGDLEVMQKLSALMKPTGLMVLTIPVGKDAEFPPACRVYGPQRLPLLLQYFAIERESYWVKNADNQWVPAEKATALAFEASAGAMDPLKDIYALGCFTLKRK